MSQDAGSLLNVECSKRKILKSKRGITPTVMFLMCKHMGFSCESTHIVNLVLKTTCAVCEIKV